MSFPVFATGDVLNASDMNAVGLWLIKTQTVGTAQTSVAVANAFSADYDHYRITYKGECSVATGQALSVQMGSTTTGYYGNMIYANSASGAPASVGDNNAANWTHCAGATQGQTTLSCDIFNPFDATETIIVSHMYMDDTNLGSQRGILRNSTSYTGFTLICPFGNITGGTIRVYGYRD